MPRHQWSTPDHLSASQWRGWLECAAARLAQQEGRYTPPTTDAMLVGSYIDAALTQPETLAEWLVENAADVFKKARKGEAAEKRAPFVLADDMIARVQADPLWKSLTARPECRMQVPIEGQIADFAWVYMADIVLETASGPVLLDLKTTASFGGSWGVQEIPDQDRSDLRTTRVYLPWYDAAGYWRQLAVGRYLWHQQTGQYPLCGILACTKEDPVSLGAWMLEDDLRFEREISRIINLQPDVLQYKRKEQPAPACGLCGFCRGQTTFEPEQPGKSGRLWTVDG